MFLGEEETKTQKIQNYNEDFSQNPGLAPHFHGQEVVKHGQSNGRHKRTDKVQKSNTSNSTSVGGIRLLTPSDRTDRLSAVFEFLARMNVVKVGLTTAICWAVGCRSDTDPETVCLALHRGR